MSMHANGRKLLMKNRRNDWNYAGSSSAVASKSGRAMPNLCQYCRQLVTAGSPNRGISSWSVGRLGRSTPARERSLVLLAPEALSSVTYGEERSHVPAGVL
jgi:hypothetical protein